MFTKIKVLFLLYLMLSGQFYSVAFAQNYNIAPVIEIIEETRQLTQHFQPPNLAITISADVSIALPMIPPLVRLFYRTNSMNYQSVEMQRGQNDSTWSGDIPASAVLEPYVEFYVRVDDGLAFATDPQFNAQDVPYRIQISATPADQEPPFIELSTQTARLIVPSNAQPMNTSLLISAYVFFDAAANSKSVTLFWRQLGQTEYFASQMTTTGLDIWRAMIPDSAVRSPEIEFFILASDDYAVTTTPETNPQERPYVITISDASSTHRPPFVQLTDESFSVIRRYQPSNQDIQMTARVVDDRGRRPHSVRCAYRVFGGIAYKHFSMQLEPDDTWTGRIKGDDVLKPGLQFFISAFFDDATVFAPSTFDPNDVKKDNPYYISVFTFNQPPHIRRTTATRALSLSPQFRFQPININVFVTDDVFPFLDSVHLYYRHADDQTFQHADMRAMNDSLFSAAINTMFVTPPGVEYYIYANDTDLEAYAPDKLTHPDSLYFIPVESRIYNEPPIIQRTSETIALADTAQLYGEPIRIAATIIDTVGHELQRATLFYRYVSSSTFSQADMLNADSLWWGMIPANVVINPTVEYYITATDGVDSAVDAAGSPPEEQPYQIDVMTPNPHPIIRHTPITSAVPDSALRIVVEVIDTTKYVGEVRLKYWHDNQADSVKMGRFAFESFEAEIPGNMVRPPSVSYQIFAWDNWGYSSRSQVYTVLVAVPGSALPNPFTPNDDGFNDYVLFSVPGLPHAEARVSIYNQRGRRVREITNTDRWDGRDDDGSALPPGVYLYAVFVNGDVTLSGTLTLIR